jgi:hypothetical protein
VVELQRATVLAAVQAAVQQMTQSHQVHRVKVTMADKLKDLQAILQVLAAVARALLVVTQQATQLRATAAMEHQHIHLLDWQQQPDKM